MISIRDAAACLGHVGAMSVVSHIFGLGTTPEYTFDQQGLSVARLFSQLSGPHIHLNLIRVGSENFDWEMEVYIAEAIQYMRDRIYSQVGLGIGRIYHYGIPLAMTQGYEVIDSFDQGKTLTNQWTAHNDGIDVFLVRHITIPPSVLGISPRPGPNDKDDDKGYSGIVVDAFACAPCANMT